MIPQMTDLHRAAGREELAQNEVSLTLCQTYMEPEKGSFLSKDSFSGSMLVYQSANPQRPLRLAWSKEPPGMSTAWEGCRVG